MGRAGADTGHTDLAVAAVRGHPLSHRRAGRRGDRHRQRVPVAGAGAEAGKALPEAVQEVLPAGQAESDRRITGTIRHCSEMI